ncbi:iron chelate uptake ABC transporter family permease subunit [Vagococcus sp.]|uniref:iron chelate uptake ABC transporter family permease subunit n=1 Tax=Vagococcus sp. TaxID=1933889 RepID=UPI003F94B3EC
MKLVNQVKTKLVILSFLTLAALFLFMTYQTYGNWSFALEIRGKKVLAFMVVSLLTATSTISFQTLTQNQFLTPSILGFDSLYVLIQTLLYFFFGTFLGQLVELKQQIFILTVILMVGVSLVLFKLLLTKEHQNLFLLLMIGMILGTLFRSLSTFLQVIMDPNEYDKLQGKLFANFANIDVGLVLKVLPIVLTLVVLYFWAATYLDVFHLGQDQALNLGISVYRFRFFIFFIISVSVAVSTALIGPVTFLGFIVANVTYQWLGTYKHRELFLGGTLLSFFILLLGQFLVEQVFHMKTTLSVIIEFSGGLYFVWKVLKERGIN